MTRKQIRLGLAALVVALAIPASAQAEFTVTESHVHMDGRSFDLYCDEREVLTFELPEHAENVEIRYPHAGDAVVDGFGRERLGTIESVVQGPDVVTVTVVGGYFACTSYPYEYRTNGVQFKALYERTLTPRVWLSEEPGGLDHRIEPKRITATYDAGWKKLRWKNWGDRTAVAKGKFYGTRLSADPDAYLSRETFTYSVEVKLTKIRLCDGRYFYTRIDTRFIGHVPAEIRRQVHVPTAASCLNEV